MAPSTAGAAHGAEPATTAATDLLTAWIEHDRRPTLPRTTNALVGQCKVWGEKLGMSWTEVHKRMMEMRRKGMSRSLIVKKMEDRDVRQQETCARSTSRTIGGDEALARRA